MSYCDCALSQADESRRAPRQRRGAVVVLMAVFMVVLVAMVAFGLDIGYICSTQAELQNAADAAALAGAHQALRATVGNDTDANSVAQITITEARQAAQQFGSYNRAGGVTLQVPANDVIVGYQADPGPQSVSDWSTGQPVPNCVQVTVRRDGTANGALPLIFAPVLGTNSSNLSATATAAFHPARQTVTGFKGTPGGPNAKLLPITISVASWVQFVNSGLSPDGTRHDNYTAELSLPNSGTNPPDNVSLGPDHTPELQGVYPDRTMPGNYGLVQFDATASAGSGNVAQWIRDGASPAELSTYGPNGIQATPTSPCTIEAGPGMKSSLVSDFASVIGQPRAIPLYSSYSGSGAGGTYTIVGFAGVTIVSASGSGNSISIVFQPTILIDSTATRSSSAQTNVTQFVYPQSPVVLVR